MKTERKALVGALIGLGIAIAYCDLLILGLVAGALAWIVAARTDFKVLSNDEESEEEES